MSRTRPPAHLRALVEAQTTGRQEQRRQNGAQTATGAKKRPGWLSDATMAHGVAVRRAYADSVPVLLVLDGYPSRDEAELLGPNRGTRLWAVDKARHAIHERVAVEADRQLLPAVQAPVRVTYTFVVPDRMRRDWDNYALMCKPVQDGLVLCGVLPGGDHWQALEGNVRFRVEPGQRRLEITLEPMGVARAGDADQG